jgi:hypothetical protein
VRMQSGALDGVPLGSDDSSGFASTVWRSCLSKEDAEIGGADEADAY